MTTTPALELTDVSVDIGGTRVIGGEEPINFSAPKGQFIALVGPNGCGKSTLLSTLFRAREIATGQLSIHGHDTSTLSVRDNARLVAALPQDERADLDFTAGEVVAFSRYAAPEHNLDRDRALCADAMERMGVSHLAQTGVLRLSGGERQRVLIARTLAQDTPVIVLDEPTNHLDLHHQVGLMAALRQLVHDSSRTVIAALHDLNLAMEADQVVLMDAGRIRSTGPPHQVLTEHMVEAVYGVKPAAVSHPITGAPRLVLDSSLHSPSHPQD